MLQNEPLKSFCNSTPRRKHPIYKEMKRLIRTLRGLLIFSAAAALLFLGQNCTAPQFAPIQILGGTGGFDGMRYLTYGPCSGNRIDVVNAISVAHNFKSAAFTRENCQD